MDYFFEQETGSEPEESWIQYHFRVQENFEFLQRFGRLTGGKAGIGFANTQHGPASGGVSGGPDGKAFSVRPSIDGIQDGSGDYKMSNYTYHADQGGQYGSGFDYDRSFDFGQWYRIDHHLKMNTPGQRDGELQSWVDGQLAVDERLRFRNTDRSFGIGRVWHNCYFGGSDPAPKDESVYFDEFYISTRGPIDDSLELS